MPAILLLLIVTCAPYTVTLSSTSQPYEAREVLAQRLRAQIADQRSELDSITAVIALSQQKYDSAMTGLHDAQHSSNDGGSSSSTLQQQTDSSTAAMDTA
jgi:hypothetical protein